MLKTKYHAVYQNAYNHGGFIDCKHNRHVDCVGGADCKECGWNPTVEKERKSKLETLFKGYLKFIKLQRKVDTGE